MKARELIGTFVIVWAVVLYATDGTTVVNVDERESFGYYRGPVGEALAFCNQARATWLQMFDPVEWRYIRSSCVPRSLPWDDGIFDPPPA